MISGKNQALEDIRNEVPSHKTGGAKKDNWNIGVKHILDRAKYFINTDTIRFSYVR